MTVLCVTTSMPGRSCTIRSYHRPNVDGLPHESRPGVPCTGCMPRPAAHGLLCEFCWSRFTATLSTLQDLIPHLRSIEKGPASVVGVRTAPGSRVILPASWMEADHLWQQLAHVAQVHAAAARLPEPDWPVGTTERGITGEGFTSAATLDQVAQAVRHLRGWVDASAEGIVARTGGAEAAVELFRAVQRTLTMFPMRDQARRIRYVRCRACNQATLRLIPPLEAPDDPTLTCGNRECGAEWDPTLADVDMLDLARTVAAEQGTGIAALERDIAELLREKPGDEVEPLCFTHAAALQRINPSVLVRKVRPVEEECVRCGVRSESGFYRRMETRAAA